MTGSLRRRMLVWTIGAMLVLLGVFSAVLYGGIRYALIRQFDESLLVTARLFCAGVEIDSETAAPEIEAGVAEAYETPGASDCYGLYRGDGSVVSESSNAAGLARFARVVGRKAVNEGEAAKKRSAGKNAAAGDPQNGRAETAKRPPAEGPVFEEWTAADGRAMRIAVLRFTVRRETGDSRRGGPVVTEKLILVMARDATGLHRELGVLGALLWGLSGATAAVAVGAGAVVVRRGLAPLETVAGEIARIDPDDLGARVASAGMPNELRVVTEQLNALLGRLEEAFARERRFTADAAHELRTPLAGIRAAIEVALTRPRDVGAYRAVLGECLGILTRMQSLVAGLLMLARLDAGQTGLDADDVRPVEMVEASRDRMMDRLSGKGVVFECEAPPQIVCRANRQMLTMILGNVLDNAAEYVNEGGSIHVAVRTAGRSVEIEVANTGSRLTDEQVSHVFERFWRADAARGDTENHAGLGLSLVKKAVEAMGGSVSASTRGGGVFAVILVLPTQ